MRVLAVDYGTVRVGLAASDELGIMASPLQAYIRTDSVKKDAKAIAQVAEGLGAVEIVVGMPTELDGVSGAAAKAAEEFADRIARYTKIRVTMRDERLTTAEAARRLQQAGIDSRKSRTLVDSEAAAVLLESYLRARINQDSKDIDAS